MGNIFPAAALGRPIFNRRLILFYFIKLFFKYKLSNLKSPTMITYCVKLHCVTAAIGGARNLREPGHNSNRRRQIFFPSFRCGECSYNINIIKYLEYLPFGVKHIIHSSLILLRNLDLIIFIVEKVFSTDAVDTDNIKANSISCISISYFFINYIDQLKIIIYQNLLSCISYFT
jgi:hypothetical protein